MEDDHHVPRKQRHAAERIFERLRDEYGFDGGYTIVRDYAREHCRQTKEMFVPLSDSYKRDDIIFDPLHYRPMLR